MRSTHVLYIKEKCGSNPATLLRSPTLVNPTYCCFPFEGTFRNSEEIMKSLALPRFGRVKLLPLLALLACSHPHEVHAAGTATATLNARLNVVADGISFSGVVPADQANPFEGTVVSLKNHSAWPGGFSDGGINQAFGSANLVGDYLWMAPFAANMVVRMHKTTGVMTGYNTWPGAVTVYDPQHKVDGAAYDRVRELLWMVLGATTHVVNIDVSAGTSGTMSYCMTPYPAGFNGQGLMGGFIHKEAHLWMGPYGGNMVIRLDMSNCNMLGFNSWPTGFTGGTLSFHGSIYDGYHYGWFSPSSASHVLKLDLDSGLMVIYNGWPTGHVKPTDYAHGGGAFDGQSVWLPHFTANMILQVDKDTGVMLGHNNWPPGYATGTFAHNSASYDGKYVWFFPRDANALLRMEVSLGTLTAIGTFETTAGRGAWTAVLDFASQKMWLPMWHNGGVVQELTFSTLVPPTPAPPVTATKTRHGSQELGLLVQDGFSYTGVQPWGQVTPFEGSVMSTTSHAIAGVGCTTNCYFGGILVGDYLWMIPYLATALVRVHRVTYAMTAFSSWPAGVTLFGGPYFQGSAYDSKRGLLWLVPNGMSNPVSVDVTTGAMAHCSMWPGTFNSAALIGGIIEREDYLWMAPYTANMIVRMRMDSCTMTGFNSWPQGFAPGSSVFGGVIRDGDHHGWFVSAEASHILKMNFLLASMTIHNTWPGGYNNPTIKFAGGTFDGQNAWFPPSNSNMIVSIDKDTDLMTGHSSWPTGFSLVGADFDGAAYDGKYVWLVPNFATHLLRVEAATGTMAAWNNWPAERGQNIGIAFDFATGCFWFPPFGTSTTLVQVFMGGDRTPTVTLAPPVPPSTTTPAATSASVSTTFVATSTVTTTSVTTTTGAATTTMVPRTTTATSTAASSSSAQSSLFSGVTSGAASPYQGAVSGVLSILLLAALAV